MSSRTVYAVAKGEYSDHYIACLFDREEDALAYAKAMSTADHERDVKAAAEHGNVREPLVLPSDEQILRPDHTFDTYRFHHVERYQLWTNGIPVVSVVRDDEYAPGYPSWRVVAGREWGGR